MRLSEQQHDALVELLNIGFGKAGASLSKLTGQRVLLEIPSVEVHPVDQMSAALAELAQGDVASVHQVFTGPVAGDALLMMSPAGAATLTQLLTNQPALALELDTSAREVLIEVGNVLLNACLGTFGNLLNVPVGFLVPEIDLARVQEVIDQLSSGADAHRFALVVTSAFRLRDAEVTGYVIIVMTVESLNRLLTAVDAWEGAQS